MGTAPEKQRKLIPRVFVGPELVVLHLFHLIQQYALRNVSRSLFYNRHTLREFTPVVLIYPGHFC